MPCPTCPLAQHGLSSALRRCLGLGTLLSIGAALRAGALWWGGTPACSGSRGRRWPIVVAGNPVPQIPGATFATFSQRVAATSDGGVVFLAYFDGAVTNVDNSGIFVAEPGQPMRLLARRGHTLVGMPDGSVIGHLGEPRVGGGDVVAFTAFLTGSGVAQTHNYALFAGDTRLNPSLILRVGDSFNIPGGATQTIRSIMFDHESVETGRSDMAGRTLAVRLTFEDRTSGLFTATLPCSADFDGDGDVGTDADIEAFFACLAGNCCGYLRLRRLQ